MDARSVPQPKGCDFNQTLRHKNRKGQEEIVGFVMIVVLVAIVLVIFLGIKLRNPEPVQRESEIIYQFLESTMEQTTDCSLTLSGAALALDELIRECYSANSLCISGSSACTAVQDTISPIMNVSWNIGPSYPYKGYELIGTYTVNASGQQQQERVFNSTKGLCGSSYNGNSYWIPEFPGSIIVSLRLCN